MLFGLGLPNAAARVDARALLRLARAAEDRGLDSVWVVDRWLRPTAPVVLPGVPVPVELPRELYASVLDPIDTLSWLVGQTERIALGTSAINVLYHPPVLLARRLATLDQLCDGRLIAGVTSGWMREEFLAAGVAPPGDHSAFDDHLAAMRAVWGPDPVSYRGSHFTVPEADIGPKPPGGRIPLLVGYNTRAGLRRAARIGDGVHPYRNDLGQLRTELDLWRDTAADCGKDPSSMPVVLRAAAALGPSDHDLFGGDVTRWGDDLAALDAIGVDHAFVQFEPPASVDAVIDALDRLDLSAIR
jgi:probable F420-dependent oxidoreductase